MQVSILVMVRVRAESPTDPTRQEAAGSSRSALQMEWKHRMHGTSIDPL